MGLIRKLLRKEELQTSKPAKLVVTNGRNESIKVYINGRYYSLQPGDTLTIIDFELAEMTI